MPCNGEPVLSRPDGFQVQASRDKKQGREAPARDHASERVRRFRLSASLMCRKNCGNGALKLFGFSGENQGSLIHRSGVGRC